MVEKVAKEFGYTRDIFGRLRKLAHSWSGITVTDEKFEMYYARLTKRLRFHKLETFREYLAMVENDAFEFKEFINCITTNVTSFGREQHHFDYLSSVLEKQPVKELSIWSAGCSSGEEPYTIIINLMDVCERKDIKLKITATDLDTDVLQKGANGVYSQRAIEKYDLKVKKRFFEKGKGNNKDHCRIKERYRKLIDFQQLNLIDDWQFSQKYDAIFCRNVLIYFDNPKKQRLARKFWEHLVPDGYLFLGHSETLLKISDDYDSVGKTTYRKRG